MGKDGKLSQSQKTDEYAQVANKFMYKLKLHQDFQTKLYIILVFKPFSQLLGKLALKCLGNIPTFKTNLVPIYIANINVKKEAQKKTSSPAKLAIIQL